MIVFEREIEAMSDLQIDTNHWDTWLKTYAIEPDSFSYEVVTDYMRDGHDLRRKHGFRIMQILELPSFDPVRSYEIFRVRGFDARTDSPADSFYLLRTIWYWDRDMERLGNEKPEKYLPDIEYAYYEIANDIVVTIFERFSKHIPIWSYPADQYLGYDGTYYELAFSGFQIGVRYRWWEDKTEGWQLLSDAFMETMTQFEAMLD